MTISDTGKIMDKLAVAYPRYYAGISPEREEQAVAMWASAFANDDARVVVAAVQSFIEMDEKGFPPVPGQIKAKIRLIMRQGEDTEAQAWAQVSYAIKHISYESEKKAEAEFAKLPEQIQRILGGRERGIMQLREWAQMKSDVVHSVVASNFQRSYRTHMAREREYNALPPDVRQMIPQISDSAKPALEGSRND